MDVRKNGKERRFVESGFNATKNGHAVGIGHVEHHDANRVGALIAQRACEKVRPVTKLFGGLVDFGLGRIRDVARERGVVENNRNRGGRESTLLCHLANRYHSLARQLYKDLRNKTVTLRSSPLFPPRVSLSQDHLGDRSQ